VSPHKRSASLSASAPPLTISLCNLYARILAPIMNGIRQKLPKVYYQQMKNEVANAIVISVIDST
jgi:hypothetical protein